MEGAAKPPARDLQVLPALTKREKQILKLVAGGQTSAIAAQLHVSALTVKTPLPQPDAEIFLMLKV